MVERLRRVSPTDRTNCVGLGDTPTTFRGTVLTRTVLKWLVVRTSFRAPPGKVKTVSEMLVTKPAMWSEDLQASAALIDRVGRGEANGIHPGFRAPEPGGMGRPRLEACRSSPAAIRPLRIYRA